MTSFDDALLAHVPDELKAQFPRDPEKPPEPKPEPARQQSPEDRATIEKHFAEQLIQAHGTWVASGQPPEGPEADALIESLTNSYLVSQDGGPFEAEVLRLADNLGATEMVAEAVEAYNRTVETAATKDQYRADAFKVFEGMPQELLDAVGNSFDEEFLIAVRDGTIDPDELRRELASRVETAREIKTVETKRDDLEQLDDALLREGPTDEESRYRYEAELKRSTAEQTQYNRDGVLERALVRSGDLQPPADPGEEAENEELRRANLLPGEAQENQDRWRAEAAAEQKSVDA